MDHQHKEPTAAEAEKLRGIFHSVYDHTPYFKLMPCEVKAIDRGWNKVLFKAEKRFCNYRGIASGGVLAAFCDTLMGMASRTLGYQVTTLEINMNYIRQVNEGETITGYGQVVHHGKKTIVVECECVNEQGEIVAKGRSSFYILGYIGL